MKQLGDVILKSKKAQWNFELHEQSDLPLADQRDKGLSDTAASGICLSLLETSLTRRWGIIRGFEEKL